MTISATHLPRLALTALVAFALAGSACDGCSSDKEGVDEGAISLDEPAPAGAGDKPSATKPDPTKGAAAEATAAAKRLAERNAGKRVGPSVIKKGLGDKARATTSKVIPNNRKPTKVANPKLAARAALANKRLAGQKGATSAGKREGIADKAKASTSVKGSNAGNGTTAAKAAAAAKNRAPVAAGPPASRTSRSVGTDNTKIDTPLPIDRYLPLGKVRELTGQLRMASVGPVPGIKPTPRYNSALYMPPGRTPTFGVGLQVWREPTRRDVTDRYLRMKGQYTNAEDTETLAPAKAFFAYYGDIMSLTFMSIGKKRVVSVACGQTVCDQKKLLDLAMATQKSL